MTVVQPVEEQVAGHGHILPAIGDDVVNAPLLPPGQGLHAAGALGRAQGFAGQMVQRKAIAQRRVNASQDIQRGQRGKIETAQAAEHRVVKLEDIETDHQVKFHQIADQTRHVLLQVVTEIVAPRVIDDHAADPHQVGPVPTAHLLGRTPGLQIQHRETKSLGQGRSALDTLNSGFVASSTRCRGPEGIMPPGDPRHLRRNGLLLRAVHDFLQHQQGRALGNGAVARTTFGRMHAGRATVFTGAIADHVLGPFKQQFVRLIGLSGQPAPARDSVIDEHGGGADLGMERNGNSAQVVPVGHDQKGHHADGRVLQGMNAAHEMSHHPLHPPSDGLGDGDPDPSRLEHQGLHIKRCRAQIPPAARTDAVISRNLVRDLEPPETDHGPEHGP